MSRDEARKRLAGTFTFEFVGDKVVIDDEALNRTIQELAAESRAYTTLPVQMLSGSGYRNQVSFTQSA